MQYSKKKNYENKLDANLFEISQKKYTKVRVEIVEEFNQRRRLYGIVVVHVNDNIIICILGMFPRSVLRRF